MNVERREIAGARVDIEVAREGRAVVLDGTVGTSQFHLAVAGTSDELQLPRLRSLVESVNGLFPVRDRFFRGIHIAVSHNEAFNLFEEDKASTSPNSGSRYLGETLEREVLMQVQPPRKENRSWPHYHDGLEIYYWLEGKLFIVISKTEDFREHQTLELSKYNPYLEIPAGLWHQVYAEDIPAASVLICDFERHIHAISPVS